MATATLTTKGQITIPVEVRASLGVDAGDRVEFVEVAPGRYEFIAATRSITALKGMFGKPRKAVSIDDEVQTLSGGNQQKVQIARWLAANTRILIMVDPTRGVDVGARREIKRIWLDLSAKGQAILLASTDAEELVDACDRVIVMSLGRQVGELSGHELTETNLLRMATDV